MLANHVFWRLMLFYTHLLLLLQPSVLWLSIVTFYNDAKPPPKWIWCITNPSPALKRYVYMAKFDSGWEGYPVWQTGLPALAGHPTYHVNVIKLKWENIWTGGLPHLSGLPHLRGVPHLHVNRPLVSNLTTSICCRENLVWSCSLREQKELHQQWLPFNMAWWKKTFSLQRQSRCF